MADKPECGRTGQETIFTNLYTIRVLYNKKAGGTFPSQTSAC